MSKNVLIIDPDQNTFLSLEKPLNLSGFLLTHTRDRTTAKVFIDEKKHSIIILDIDTKLFEAFDFCRELRFQDGDWTPLILVSEKDHELDLVLGLELGADDFVRKPLRPKELIARIKSILRREEIGSLNIEKQKFDLTDNEDIITVGDLIIDFKQYSVYMNNKYVELTRKEFEILQYLCVHVGKVIRREELLTVIRDDHKSIDDRIIDVFISRLREKIEPNRKNPSYIKTVRNIGYTVSPPVKLPFKSQLASK